MLTDAVGLAGRTPAMAVATVTAHSLEASRQIRAGVAGASAPLQIRSSGKRSFPVGPRGRGGVGAVGGPATGSSPLDRGPATASPAMRSPAVPDGARSSSDPMLPTHAVNSGTIATHDAPRRKLRKLGICP